MKMSIARAMKEKNRIVAKMRDFVRTFGTNVYMADRQPKENVQDNFFAFVSLQNSLIELKQKIAEANCKSGVSNFLYEKEELSSRLCYLRSIPTDTESNFSRNPVTGEMEEQKKSAFLSYEFVSENIKTIESKIFELQDKIDELNATNFIEFENPMK